MYEWKARLDCTDFLPDSDFLRKFTHEGLWKYLHQVHAWMCKYMQLGNFEKWAVCEILIRRAD